MDLKTLTLHPDFPEKVWVVVEQPGDEPYRLSYDPASGTFTRTTYKALSYERGFHGAYGWIGGLGAPPEPHYDVFLLTEQNPQPGAIILGFICGVFIRGDGDHKFVALDAELRDTVARADLAVLKPTMLASLKRLYPRIGEHEGWFGAEEAQSYLKQNPPTHA